MVGGGYGIYETGTDVATIIRGIFSNDPQAKFDAAVTLWNPATGATNAYETFVGYHGTSSIYEESIRKEINPPTGSNFGGYAQLGEGFYTSPEYKVAERFAQNTAALKGGEPIVLEIYAQNFDQMSGIVIEKRFWNTPEMDFMPQSYIENYDMNVAPVAGFKRGWQIKFNPRSYDNLVAR